MNFCFLFSGKEKKCSQIYAEENGAVFSYSMDEDIIVKNEESSFLSLDDLKGKFAEKSLKTKVLAEKEFPGVNGALRFLNSSQTNFDEGVPHFKRLPEIVNPYDMDFGMDDAYDEEDEAEFPGRDDEMPSAKKNGKKKKDEDDGFYSDDFRVEDGADFYGDDPGFSDDFDNY